MSAPWAPVDVVPQREARRWWDGIGTGEGGGGETENKVKWWDGSAMQEGTVVGWWDGSSIQPVKLVGWWDGSSIQPVAGGA